MPSMSPSRPPSTTLTWPRPWLGDRARRGVEDPDVGCCGPTGDLSLIQLRQDELMALLVDTHLGFETRHPALDLREVGHLYS